MSNKDPFGMQKPAQEFRSMLQIQRERAEEAEQRLGQLREAFYIALTTLEDEFGMDSGPANHARNALKASEAP